MNKQLFVHLFIGVCLALAMAFLYSKSHLDVDSHADNIDLLLKLQRDEAEFSFLVEKAYAGRLKNFDALVLVQKQRAGLIKNLANRFHDLTPTSLMAQEVRVVLRNHYAVVDRLTQFKQRLSIRRLSTLYFPRVSRSLRHHVQSLQESGEETFLDFSGLLELIVELQQKIDTYITGDLSLLGEIESDLDDLASEVDENNEALNEKMDDFIRFSKLRIQISNQVSDIYHQLSSAETQNSLVNLNDLYNHNRDVTEESANQYRLAFFVLSLSLLLYLAKNFFSLQQLSANLKGSLEELNFRQFALDEHAIVSITDAHGMIKYANNKFCLVSQYTEQELMGSSHRLLKSGEHTEKFYADLWGTISKGNVWQGTICNKAKDASLYWVESTILPRMSKDGHIKEYIAMLTDVTEKVLSQKEVEWLARFPDENPYPVMRFDKHGERLYSNSPANEMLALWEAESQSWRLQQLLDINIASCIEEEKAKEVIADVADREYVLIFTPIVDSGYINIYARDVTEKLVAERLLNYQASHDPLTGLRNRLSFIGLLDEIVINAKISNKESVLLYMDLDQFKVVNDTCGHMAGDELLRQISVKLSNSVREGDTLVRLGGDEFALLLVGCHMDKGLGIANNLLEVVNEFHFAWENRSFRIGMSIGAVTIDQFSDSKDGVLAAADMACYSAKDAGRNRVHRYQDNDGEENLRREEMQWAGRIPEALSHDNFVLMVQSIVPLQVEEDSLGHYEILIRWRDDDGSLIPPGAFISAAERYDLMPAIDHWVLRKLFSTMSGLQKRGEDLLDWRFAVNLSGTSMGDENLIAYIKKNISELNLPPGSLSFEVTETAAVSNLSTAIEFITELRDIGCHFALDDFGSGLSSFAYLKNLPVDYLKIDGAFVKDILDDPIDEAMVKSINEIGHVMNLKTIAEFVENDGIRQRLADLGVDYAQGYGIDKPQELDKIIKQRLSKRK